MMTPHTNVHYLQKKDVDSIDNHVHRENIKFLL